MKLASIEKILDISPIEGADRIELARVLGYQTVIKKGEFKVGDWCVWHSPDTIVDETNPVYAFLSKNSFRLRTARFKKMFSQGLALPLQMMAYYGQPVPYGVNENGQLVIPPSIISTSGARVDLVEGVDVSDVIKIKKYEKPIPACLAGISGGAFPTHIVPKTDEPLLRSNPKAVQFFAGKHLYGTLKLDGSSGTYFYLEGEFGVCSRNLRLKESEGNSFWQIARKYDLENKFKALGHEVVVQGEVVGPGIQNNPIGLSEVDFFAFNVLFPNPERRYANRADYLKFCADHNIKVVPLVWEGSITYIDTTDIIKNIDYFQNIVNALKYSNGKPAEGMVIRPAVEEDCHALGSRLSAKIINENYND